MSRTLDTLLCGLVAFLCLLAYKGIQVTDQVSATVEESRSAIAESRHVLAELRPNIVRTTETLKTAAREQASYYKATGKALAIATADLARLIRTTDKAVAENSTQAARTLQAAEGLIIAAGLETTTTSQVIRESVTSLTAETQKTLAAAGAQVANPEIAATLTALKDGAESGARGIQHLEHIAETGVIVTDPWRKTAGKLKSVFMLVLKMLSINLRGN